MHHQSLSQESAIILSIPTMSETGELSCVESNYHGGHKDYQNNAWQDKSAICFRQRPDKIFKNMSMNSCNFQWAFFVQVWCYMVMVIGDWWSVSVEFCFFCVEPSPHNK